MSRHPWRTGAGSIALAVAVATITGCSGSTAGTADGGNGAAATNAPVAAPSASPLPTAAATSPKAVALPKPPLSSAEPTTTTAAGPSSSSAGNGGGAAPSDKPIKVGKSINDTVLGDRAKVIAYIPSFPLSSALQKKYSLAEQGKEVLLLELTVSAGKKYYSTFGKLDFMVLDGSGIPVSETTELVAKDMKAAGYQPLQDAETGQTRTGWVAYFVAAHAKSLTVQYHRLATKVLGSGKEIPAKNFNVTLPK